MYVGEAQLESCARKLPQPPEGAFPAEVAFVFERGLMEYTQAALRLTPFGAKHYNGVIALFYAGAVKERLLKLARGERVKPVHGWRKVWQPEYETLRLTAAAG